jgi:hypothetical protein
MLSLTFNLVTLLVKQRRQGNPRARLDLRACEQDASPASSHNGIREKKDLRLRVTALLIPALNTSFT